jgi:hypothetical protein
MHSPDFEVLSLFLVSPATVNDFGDFCRVKRWTQLSTYADQ